MLEQSLLYQEIHDQPQSLAALLSGEKEPVQEIVDHIQRKRITHAVIAARGTSDNAARYAQYLLGSANRLQVALATPSLFSIYKRPPRFDDALVIGISQSGQSPDIVSVVAEGRRQGAITVAITNTPDFAAGTGGRSCHQFTCRAGTVGRRNQNLHHLSRRHRPAQRHRRRRSGDAANIGPAAGTGAAGARLRPAIARAAERYRYMRVCVVIGRGYNYATAFELALKIKELTYIMAEPYSSADFMHGPVAVVEEAFPTIVIAPSGLMLPEMVQMIRDLKERGAEVIAISDDDDTLALARTPFKLPVSVPEWVSPLVSIIPGQLLAMNLAHVRDYDIDRPRGLHKVTETT